MRGEVKYLILFLTLSLVLVDCASVPSSTEEFSESQPLQGNLEEIPASMEVAWDSALEVLSREGFLVQQTDARGRLILAGREVQDKNDKDYSHTVTLTLTFVPLSDQLTRVMVAANETVELHRREYRWWNLLWLIPLFPTGTDYTTVVVNRDTVRSSKFYQGFFVALRNACEGKKVMTQPVPRS